MCFHALHFETWSDNMIVKFTKIGKTMVDRSYHFYPLSTVEEFKW